MLNELLKKDFVFFDGSIGVNLQKMGLPVGQRPDIMNMTAPDAVEGLQRAYCLAGSDILCTNTFGANAKVLKGSGYTVEEIISAGVGITKRAGMGRTLTALDIGPIGDFISPFGSLTFDESYELYRQQAVAGEKAGADLAAIETMSDLLEVKAAMLAIRENTKLPIFVTMTFDKSGRTFTGCRPESFALTAERLGAAAVGINCSLAPGEIVPIAEKLARATRLPVIIKPNAGLPRGISGSYDIDAEEFARQMAPYAALGAKIVGGCCGTTPEYIRVLIETYGKLKPSVSPKDTGERICSPMQVAYTKDLNAEAPGKLPVSADDIIESALEQADSGACVIRVSLDGQDASQAAGLVRSIQSQTDIPLWFVSGGLDALEQALRAVTGIAAVSSSLGGAAELKRLEDHYGAVLIG